MSDYISKSALVEVLEKSMKDNNHITIEGSTVHAQEHRHIIHLVEKQPTISETEIIRKAFERVLERLEEDIVITWEHDYLGGKKDAFMEAIEIVKEECGISE